MIQGRVSPIVVAVLVALLAGGCCLDNDSLGIGGGGVGGGGGGVPLGTAGNFASLAGSTITSTGLTSITGGDIGVNGPEVTGFPPGTHSGVIYTNPPDVALITQAQSDLTDAYNDAAGRTEGVITVAGDLGGETLAPGLYMSTSTLMITGTLTLDVFGDPDGVFIFQIASGLTTATGSQVLLTGGAQAQNVYWQVGSSAVLGDDSQFAGTIMADQSISLNSGARLDGRALARVGAVTLINNLVVVP